MSSAPRSWPSRLSANLRGRALRERVGSSAFTAVFLLVGCAGLAGVDKDYVRANSELEGDASTFDGAGGSGASGGVGGAGGAGGLSGSGGTESCEVVGCPFGEKCCGALPGSSASEQKICVGPAPINGCGSSDCSPCAQQPSNGVVVCRDTRCAIQCNQGFREENNDCVPDGTGGSGGSGTGGTAGAPACNFRDCGPCSVVGPFPCCRNDDICGCSWFPFGYCF